MFLLIVRSQACGPCSGSANASAKDNPIIDKWAWSPSCRARTHIDPSWKAGVQQRYVQVVMSGLRGVFVL